MKRKLLLMGILASLISLPHVRGQSIWPSTLNASGGSVTLGGRTYEWSIGEMTLVNTAATSTIVVTQGLLQPEHGNTTAVDNTSMFQYLSVYPNPANNTVNLTFNSPQQAVMGLRLMDMTGKLIQEKTNDIKIGTNTGQLDISSLAAATYVLQVTLTSGDKLLETTAYKIQKLQ